MKILCLYNNPCALGLFDWLLEQGHETVLYSDKLDSSWCRSQGFELAVSYTYRFILPGSVIGALKHNVVNIHNSFLPFNRGADPNIWSIVDGKPRGVTLHYIDGELDHGSIIAQSIVPLKPDDTLKTSYDALDKAAKELFKAAFIYYPFWKEMAKQPESAGTYHSLADGQGLRDIVATFDMAVSDFRTEVFRQLGGGISGKVIPGALDTSFLRWCA